ncbi:MAG: hypothetical protein IKW48_01570 [Akkermansia sp.]|nr:hypothetical protein [Akkermansia sp.]
MNYFIAALAVLASTSFAWAQGPHKHMHKDHHGKPAVHHGAHKPLHATPRVTGTWVGVCQNVSVNVKSPMILNLHRKGNRIMGTVMLDSSKLVSAPQLVGFVKGDTIAFTTGSHDHPLGKIEWLGQVTGSVIRGVYRTGSSQEGVFLLKLK